MLLAGHAADLAVELAPADQRGRVAAQRGLLRHEAQVYLDRLDEPPVGVHSRRLGGRPRHHAPPPAKSSAGELRGGGARPPARALAAVEAPGEVDPKGETLRRLAGIRDAIAGRVRDAGTDVGALRAALASVFSTVRVEPERMLYTGAEPADAAPHLHARLEPGAAPHPRQLCLVPVVRPEALNAHPRNTLVDSLRRVGVPLDADTKNQHLTFVS